MPADRESAGRGGSKFPLPGSGILSCLMIFAAALMVRLLFLEQISSVPYFDSPIIDPKQYDDFARSLLEKSAIGLKPFYHLPGFRRCPHLAAHYPYNSRGLERYLYILSGRKNILFPRGAVVRPYHRLLWNVHFLRRRFLPGEPADLVVSLDGFSRLLGDECS